MLGNVKKHMLLEKLRCSLNNFDYLIKIVVLHYFWNILDYCYNFELVLFVAVFCDFFMIKP